MEFFVLTGPGEPRNVMENKEVFVIQFCMFASVWCCFGKGSLLYFVFVLYLSFRQENFRKNGSKPWKKNLLVWETWDNHLFCESFLQRHNSELFLSLIGHLCSCDVFLRSLEIGMETEAQLCIYDCSCSFSPRLGIQDQQVGSSVFSCGQNNRQHHAWKNVQLRCHFVERIASIQVYGCHEFPSPPKIIAQGNFGLAVILRLGIRRFHENRFRWVVPLLVPYVVFLLLHVHFDQLRMKENLHRHNWFSTAPVIETKRLQKRKKCVIPTELKNPLVEATPYTNRYFLVFTLL